MSEYDDAPTEPLEPNALPAGDEPPAAQRSGRSSRLLASRGVAAIALVAVGAAAGAGVTHAVSNHGSAHASSPAGRSFSPGAPSSGGSSSSGTGNGFGEGTFGGGGFGGNGFGGPPSGLGGGQSGGSTTANSNASDGPTDAAAIARDANAGVVDITTTVSGGEAAGTGMVLTSDGEVLTNNHVISGATSISVRDVGNGTTYKATVVGYDRSHDVAVLQLVDASGLSTVKLASTEPSSGAAVVAIGNAGGTGGTPSYAGGAITGTDKTITASDASDGTSEKLTGLLATDADIQAGDSGGPLVNTAGEVVGMDTAASSGFSFGSTGSGTASRGYAIPIAAAAGLAATIEAGQASSTVHIGPTAELGVYISTSAGDAGALVEKTVPSGPAAGSGIARRDVITSVNGVSIHDASDLSKEIARLAPGQVVSVAFLVPSGDRRTVRVTLGTGVPQ
jgi:S1-C subfamily serine protease